MKFNLSLFCSILYFFYLICQRLGKQDGCPRVQNFFDFQDESDKQGYKEITAITHIQGSTLVAIGTKVGAIEIWDYDSREIITKFFENLWPIDRIDHIGHTNHIVVKYKKNNGNVVSIWDLVSQERVLWILEENNEENNYQDIFKQRVIDTYLSLKGNYFLQMSQRNVVACDIRNISQNKPSCETYAIPKNIKDETPIYIFSFDSLFENEFFIMTKISIYRVDRKGLSLNDKIYRVENNAQIVDMIRIQQDGIVMIALNTNELITLNLQTNNGSEKIYQLRDYLQYIPLNQIVRLLEVKSFFSESSVLILFEVNQSKDSSNSNNNSVQIIITYNINEDKVVQFEKVHQAKFIAPINQSRSFIVVFEDDTVGWFAYPVILKQIPSLTTQSFPFSSQFDNAVIRQNFRNQLFTSYNFDFSYQNLILIKSIQIYFQMIQKIIGLNGTYIIQDDLEGSLIQYSLEKNNIEKKQDLILGDEDNPTTVQSMLSIDKINQYIVLTNNFDIIIFSYDILIEEPLFFKNLLGLIVFPQEKSQFKSNSYLLNLKQNSSIAIITGYNILVFNYENKLITHSVSTQIEPQDILINCLLTKQLLSDDNKYWLVVNGEQQLSVYTIKFGKQTNENEISSDVSIQLNSSIINSNIVGVEHIKELDLIITQNTKNEFCKYEINEFKQINCFKVWYDETAFQSNAQKKRGLFYIKMHNILVAQISDMRIVFIDLKIQLPIFSSCKFEMVFSNINLLSEKQLILLPSALSKQKISFFDYYEEKPINKFRNMKGVIQESHLHNNQLLLNMQDGSFKALNVENNDLYELIYTYINNSKVRKFLVDHNQIIFIDSDYNLFIYNFDSQYRFVMLYTSFSVQGINITDTTHLEITSLKNVIAVVNDKSIFYINYETQSIQNIYNSNQENINAVNFNQTLSLIVIGLSNKRVELLDVKDINNPIIKHSITTKSDVIQVQHSIMFNDRVYFSYPRKIMKWEVLTNELTEIQAFKDNIKQVIFILEIQAIVVFLDSGVVQIINDDKNLFYFINVKALTQSYANVNSLIYMPGLNSLAFISDHRIWGLQLYNFIEEDRQQNLTQAQIQCEKGFYIESMQGQDYFNILGQGTKMDPYKSVSAIRKETIKIGKSHKIFMYNTIKLNFFLQEGKTHQLEEPFQYATQKINSIVTFGTYKADSTNNNINFSNQISNYQYYSAFNIVPNNLKVKLPITTLIIKNNYQFDNIYKLYFYNINIQLGSNNSGSNNLEDVKHSTFNNIDQIFFIKCNFIPQKNDYNAYIFQKVQVLAFSDVKISQTQFITQSVLQISMNKVESNLLPPSQSILNKKKCLVKSISESDQMQNQAAFRIKKTKLFCKFYYFYPTNSENYLFIYQINQKIISDFQEDFEYSSSINTNNLLQNQQKQTDQNKNKQYNNKETNYGQSLQYNIEDSLFQYIKMFTFLIIKDANNNNEFKENIYPSPQLNISNTLIRDTTIFSGLQQDNDDLGNTNNLQNFNLNQIKFNIQNHTLIQSNFIKVFLYEGSSFKVRELNGLRLLNNTFDRFSISISKSIGTKVKDIIIENNKFESSAYLPLFELGKEFQVQNISFRNNTFNNTYLFAYKTEFMDSQFDSEIIENDELEEEKQQQIPFSNPFQRSFNFEQQININNSTLSNISFKNCTFKRTTVFSQNELLDESIWLLDQINIVNSQFIETKVFDIMNLQKSSIANITNLIIKNVSLLRSCLIRKLSDQTLIINNSLIHKNLIRYSNILQTKRDPSQLQNKNNLIENIIQNLIISSNIWQSSKLAELSQNSILILRNTNITNNTLTSESTSLERQSKFFIELDHIYLQKVELNLNTFNYQLFCGPPLLNNQFVDYQITELNVYNNTFNVQSNAILIEATFSIISRGSIVKMSKINLLNNIRVDSNISRGTFLVEGYRFFFFHFDKIQTTQVNIVTMLGNTEVGFGVFKNSIGASWVSSLLIQNEDDDSIDLNYNANEYLKQPLLIVRNGANFTVKNSVIENMKIYNSPIIELESNKNFYTKTNHNNELNFASITHTQISNLTCTNNVIQIDPYLCEGSVIDFSSNLMSVLKLTNLNFNSNIIKGLNQNSLYQAQINIAATQSNIQILNSNFALRKDYRFVKKVADSMFLVIQARNVSISNSSFSSVPNNQTDEESKGATQFNQQVVGSISYQTFVFYKCIVSSMRSQNLGIFLLNTISDNSFTSIHNSTFYDLIPSQVIFDIKGNLFSSMTRLKNNRFENIFGQIINTDRISYMQAQILQNIFTSVYSEYTTLLDIMNTDKQITSIYFNNNIVSFNQTALSSLLNFYSPSHSIYTLIQSRINKAASILKLINVMNVQFQGNSFLSQYSDTIFTEEDLSLVLITNCQLVSFKNNQFANISNSFISTLIFNEINSLFIQDLTIQNCSSVNQRILQFRQISDMVLKDFIFEKNTLIGLDSNYCIFLKNSCMRANNLLIRNNKCKNGGPLYIMLQNRLPEQSRCLIYNQDQNNIISHDSQDQITKYEVLLNNLQVKENSGNQFGGIRIQNSLNVIVHLNNTEITQNRCEEQSGGGLFLTLKGSHNFYLSNTTVVNNYAQNRGGGIYIDEDIPQSLIKYDPTFIHDNISPTNSQVCSNGRILRFKLNDGSKSKEHYQLSQNQPQSLKIDNQQSGAFLPVIIAEVLDQDGMRVLPDTQRQIHYSKMYLSPSTQNQGYYLKGDLQVEYNNEINGFLFQNITIYGKPDSSINITFSTKMIEYESQNSTQKLQSEYTIQIQVQLRKCIIGEIYLNGNLYESCYPCPEKEYSIEDPNLVQNLNCLECPKNAECPGRNNLELHQGFWRKDEKSLEIIYCGKEPRNCQGGVQSGDNSCGNNMKGPLCEQCDIERGYTNISSSMCLECSEIGWTLTILISILLFFLIYILISIDSTVRRIKHSRSISSKSGTNTVFVASMVVKLFISYLQVVSILESFQLNINPFATQGALSLGNPVLSFSNTMDCYLYKIGQQLGVNHIYLNFFTSLLIPIVFMLFISLVDYLNNRQNYYYRSYFVKTMFLVILLFFGPLAFQNGLKLITCRKVGKTDSYIQYNMLYQCYTPEYYTYSIMVIAPLTFIICALIPFILVLLIKRRKARKVSIKTYQYLLGDYKEGTYYWEFIKYTQKLTIMMISVYFSQDIKTKALFINLILISYGTIVFFVKPFKTDILNKLDILTTLIIFLSIHFGLMAYEKSESNKVQWYFCIIQLTIMNIPLFIWYIYTIFKCYSPWFSMKKRNIKMKLMRFRIFRSSQKPKERAQLNWKNLYNKYIEDLKLKQFGSHGLNQTCINDNEFDHIPFLQKNKLINSFSTERTSDRNRLTITQIRSDRGSVLSQEISDQNEQSPNKILSLRFLTSNRKSLGSNEDTNKGEDNRKRFHTSAQNRKTNILQGEGQEEQQKVHRRFSQLIEDMQQNQDNIALNNQDMSIPNQNELILKNNHSNH